MNRRALALPPPPAGRTGWPWTVPRPQASGVVERLKVTVVTPSYNQAAFLEATLRSVLLQDYPLIEYLVIDGGSTDGSVDIITAYRQLLDYAVSEPDRGQAHAINKGFQRATGDVVAWLNSDDQYTPGTIARIVSEFEAEPDLEWVYGDCVRRTEPGGALSANPSEPMDYVRGLPGYSPICQPAAFFRRTLLEATGGLDESFRLAMDYDLWLRAIKHRRPRHLCGTVLAVTSDHADAKSRSQLGEVVFESTRAMQRFYAAPDLPKEALGAKRVTLGHLYFECAAAAVLWRKSPAQAVPWFVRAAAQDPRVLMRVPRMLADLVVWRARLNR